ILAKIFKNGRMLRRKRSKIIDRLVDPGCQTGRGHVVPQNSPIYHLRKKRRLRNQLPHQVRNVFLPLRRKRLLIPRASAKRDDNHLPSLGRNAGQSDGVPQKSPTQCHSRTRTEELPAAPSQPLANQVVGVRFTGSKERSPAS